MENKLGNRIIKLRRAKNMTQEALAKELGVSAPAVSKWETDSSLPDVTLLCPLARALDTDLNTLFCFEETMPDTELKEVGARLTNMIYAGNGYEAEKDLVTLLRKYPSDIVLKISAISLYSILLPAIADATDEDKQRWSEQKKKLAQWIYDSQDPTYRKVAISMLTSIAIEEEDFDRAKCLLQEVEKSFVDYMDFTMLEVSLHLKKGEKEQAMQILLRQQKLSTGQLLSTMTGMLRADMEPSKEQILTLCEQMQTLEEMFPVETPSCEFIYAESYIRADEHEKALEHLEKGIMNASPALKPIILQALSSDECFEPVRNDSRFISLIERLESDG